MATDFIDKLRAATFPTVRRGGYDPAAVDTYLQELADWLESGGDDQTRSALIQTEMERVGERTGSVLAAAQQTADDVIGEARTEATKVREAAEREAAEARSNADSYSSETRSAADEHVRISAEAAAREAADMRKEAEEEARAKIEDAERRLQEASEEAARRTAGVEQEIAALVEKREAILKNLEELASGIRGTVEGPGVADLKLPEHLLAKAKETHDSAELAVAEPETAVEPAVGGDGDEPTGLEADEEEIAEAELEQTQVAEQEVAEAEAAEEAPTELAAEEDDEDDELEAERERARREEIERRRSKPADPPTEDQSLTDLL
jgi:DivIVA domain-containing protein